MAKLTLKTSLSLATQARLYSTMGKDALSTSDVTKTDNKQLSRKKVVPSAQLQKKLDALENIEGDKPAPRKWKEYVKKVAGVQEWLHEKWPQVFDLANPKPLKRHIENDIMALAGDHYTVTQIRKALGAYTRRTDYMKAMIDQNWRYDLDNQPIEEITQQQKDYTQVKMVEKDQQVKQRMKEFDEKLAKLKIARNTIGKLKKANKNAIKSAQQSKRDAYKRHALIEQAQIEAKQKNCGNANNAGAAIEKYLAPLRAVLGKSDPKYLDLEKGFDWCALFVHYLVNQCGFNVPFEPKPGSGKTMGLVGVWYEWARSNNKFYMPEIPLISGDIILFDRLVSSSPLDHMGIIITPLPTYIITAEGNIDRSTGIFKREYDETFRGFIRL